MFRCAPLCHHKTPRHPRKSNYDSGTRPQALAWCLFGSVLEGTSENLWKGPPKKTSSNLLCIAYLGSYQLCFRWLSPGLGRVSCLPSQSFKINHLAVPATERLTGNNRGTCTSSQLASSMDGKWTAHLRTVSFWSCELLDPL